MMFATDVQPFSFHFTVDAKPKTRGVVPAPATPFIPDDDNAAFSQYMIHNNNVSPSSASSFSSGPLSSSSTSSYSELHSFHAYNSTPTPAPSESTPPPPQTIPHVPPQPPPPQDSKRPTGACTRCKKMKMKCEFLPGAASCQRCATRFPCVVEGRKPRTPSQREWLLAQLREKDSVIASLLSAYKPSAPTPLVLSTNKLLASLKPPPPLTSLSSPSTTPTPNPLDPAEKARFREALLAAEKGAPTSATKRWTAAAAGADDDSDGASQSSSSDDEDSHDDAAWDDDAYVLPEPAAPMGLLARMSLDMERGGKKRGADALEAAAEEAEGEGEEWGIAGREYFMPGPSTNLPLRRVLHTRDAPPMLIASRLLTWRDAEGLFQLFYQYINPYVSVLDPVLHTCSSVYARCPFLFTVVCAISLRYSPAHAHTPSLYTLAMHFAKTAAATAFVDGVKSVEMVQAYFLLSLYGPAARRWEEDRSWFYGGLATRIAIDLGLHKQPPSTSSSRPTHKSELTARERRNRARTWLICFNIDRSSAAQFGKPRGVHSDDAVAEMVGAGRRWYKERWAHPYDLHLVMYVELLRVMGRFHERVAGGGGAGKCDLRAATEATEEELKVWHDDITWRYENESDPNDPGSVFRTKGVPLFENYMKLVMYSFGFQDAWKRHRVEPDNVFFAKCLQAASTGVRHIIDVIAPLGYLKYAPDCYFVMGGFSSAFLIKLLRPEFSSLIDTQQRTRIKTLVRALVDVLASPVVAIDEAHTPKLYARFLHGQLRAVDVQEDGEEGGTQVERQVQVRALSEESQTQVHTDAEATPPPPLFSHSTPGGASSPATSVPTPPAGYQWSDSGSGSATAAPGEGGFEFDMGTGMELCEEDYLATMQAVSSEGWLNTMLMPGFSDKWGGGGEWGGVGGLEMDVVGRE